MPATAMPPPRRPAELRLSGYLPSRPGRQSCARSWRTSREPWRRPEPSRRACWRITTPSEERAPPRRSGTPPSWRSDLSCALSAPGSGPTARPPRRSSCGCGLPRPQRARRSVSWSLIDARLRTGSCRPCSATGAPSASASTRGAHVARRRGKTTLRNASRSSSARTPGLPPRLPRPAPLARPRGPRRRRWPPRRRHCGRPLARRRRPSPRPSRRPPDTRPRPMRPGNESSR
mmetsp:Transcript_124389/g.398349  ORF Transcript_124389/g.398349 Transcript_124389/m.398349 type:complete len:232 (-) Transcript_124389:1273-1968(-)